jgi:arylsulfatase A
VSRTDKPNILFILADDMGYGDFSLFNYGTTQTPALDQLVQEGICLTQHYAGSALCAPARASLLTGRYPQRTGVIDTMAVGGMDRLSLQETTIADVLGNNGYRTGLIGKWHCGIGGQYHPTHRGFQEFVGFCGGGSDYYDWTLYRNETRETSDGRYLTDVFTEEAIGFLRRDDDRPFFLHLAYNAPHGPYQAPQEDLDQFLGRGDWTKGVAYIYAMIRRMDLGIGRVLAELEQLGLRENTLVIFSSDNGPQFGGVDPDWITNRFNCGFRGAKGYVYEGGIRVPTVVRWPAGLEAGRYNHAVTHFADWFPTLLGLAGIPVPGGLALDGADILGTLCGEPAPALPRFWQFSRLRPLPRLNAAMRDGDWKLVYPGRQFAGLRYREDGRVTGEIQRNPEAFPDPLPEPVGLHVGHMAASWLERAKNPQLFNLASDPMEQHDLSATHPTRTARMAAALADWFTEVDRDLCAIDEIGKMRIEPLE